MLVPLSWLKEFIPLNLTPDEIADVLTLAGLEVEKVEKMPLNFAGLVIGKVQEVSKHPNADNLRVAKVFDGSEVFDVVCGAPNCREGLITAFAKIGTTLTDEKGKIWKIKRSKIRDVESFGMLCSEKELGLSEEHEGIIEFGSDAAIGRDLEELFGDIIFEISLTPNLGHCMSLQGIARELSALLDLPTIPMEFSLKNEIPPTEKIAINIEAPEECFQYSYRIIDEIKTLETPLLIKNRLEKSGVRSVNAIVDITNYVMLEMGQPLHAFDLDKLEGNQISVKCASKDEELLTLDEKTRKIPAGTLLICDAKKSIAVAGVMGCKNSEVDHQTKRILLEAAHFDPSSVRKGSKLAGVRTDASSRFEKGIDAESVSTALRYAATLLESLGGRVSAEVIEKTKSFEAIKLSVRVQRINALLGTSLSLREVSMILKKLHIIVKESKNETLHLTIPSYRNDLDTEIDIIEEIARIYGYNNIEKSTPKFHQSTLSHAPIYLLENDIRAHLVNEGLQEFVTCDLINPEIAHLPLEKPLSKENLIHVLHPSSVDQSVLRTTLLPGLLLSVKENFDHQIHDINAFELGRIHYRDEGEYKEREVAAILLTGRSHPHHWDKGHEMVDFYDLKGILENLLEPFSEKMQFTTSDFGSFHPGKQAKINLGDLDVGSMGEVHPHLLQAFDIKRPVYFAEIDLLTLLKLKKGFHQMQPLPEYPGSERDWTVSVDENLEVGDILNAINAARSTLLKEVKLLDLYQGENVEKGKKNLTFRFLYRSDKKTVEMKSVEKEHARVLQLIKTSN